MVNAEERAAVFVVAEVAVAAACVVAEVAAVVAAPWLEYNVSASVADSPLLVKEAVSVPEGVHSSFYITERSFARLR